MLKSQHDKREINYVPFLQAPDLKAFFFTGTLTIPSALVQNKNKDI